MAFFKRLFRKVMYFEELQNILKEEDILLKMWKKEWSRVTRVLVEDPGFGPLKKENALLKSLWKDLVRLNRESQKVSEIWKLTRVEEKKLPENKRKILRELRVNLGREGFGRRLNVEAADYGEYRKIVKYLVSNEIEFWRHLNEEKDRMKKRIREEEAAIRHLKKIAEKFISRIESDDPRWARGYSTIFNNKSFRAHIFETRMTFKEAIGRSEEDFLEFMEEEKDVHEERLKGLISNCEHILNFFKRANNLLKEVEKRLKATRPKSGGAPYRSIV